jgi:hypothetical protein
MFVFSSVAGTGRPLPLSFGTVRGSYESSSFDRRVGGSSSGIGDRLAATRNWQSGTLTGTEQEKVKEGSTKTSSTEGTAKDKGNKTEFSKDTTTTTTDNIETYQIYTIETDKRVYVAKEHLLFPWSKSANVTVGEAVKFTPEKNKIYILDDDGKEHKATVVKVSMKGSG